MYISRRWPSGLYMGRLKVVLRPLYTVMVRLLATGTLSLEMILAVPCRSNQ